MQKIKNLSTAMKYKYTKNLKQIKDSKKLFNYACYWLNRYPCSTLKLKERLLKKSTNEKQIDEVILRLKELHYLDDKRIALNTISNYLKKGYGKNRINMKLYEKKIFDKDIISAAWRENENIQEREIILNLIEKKENHYNLNDAKGKKALISYLLRRGFNYDDIIEAMSKKAIL